MPPRFYGRAFFSKNVPVDVVSSWLNNGGSKATKYSETDWFFCTGPQDNDPDVVRFKRRPIVMFHYSWIKESLFRGILLSVSQFVADESWDPTNHEEVGDRTLVNVKEEPLDAQAPETEDEQDITLAESRNTSHLSLLSSESPSPPPRILVPGTPSEQNDLSQLSYRSPGNVLILTPSKKSKRLIYSSQEFVPLQKIGSLYELLHPSSFRPPLPEIQVPSCSQTSTAKDSCPAASQEVVVNDESESDARDCLAVEEMLVVEPSVNFAPERFKKEVPQTVTLKSGLKIKLLDPHLEEPLPETKVDAPVESFTWGRYVSGREPSIPTAAFLRETEVYDNATSMVPLMLADNKPNQFEGKKFRVLKR